MRRTITIILICALCANLMGCQNTSKGISASYPAESEMQIAEQTKEAESLNEDAATEENTDAETASEESIDVEATPEEIAGTGSEEDNTTQTWQSAYLEILYHLTDNLAPVYRPDGTAFRNNIDFYDPQNIDTFYLGLHDFEGDGTCELIAGDDLSMAVFTYKDGQAEKIADLYFLDYICINAVCFKDNSIGLVSCGGGGTDYVNFGYLDGEYLLGIYCELNGDAGITVNGIESTYDDVDRIYTLDWNERKEDKKEWMMLVYENEQWILKYQSGEEVVLDSDFDFESFLW